jgi:hypothetical protein
LIRRAKSDRVADEHVLNSKGKRKHGRERERERDLNLFACKRERERERERHSLGYVQSKRKEADF